jgi:hypothetical protein
LSLSRTAIAALGCATALGAGCGAGGLANRTPRLRYLAIAVAGNRRLEADLDPLERRDRNRLARADADLRDAAATERLFDRRLLRIAFPSRTEPVARWLYRVNEARARLTAAAAGSKSLRALDAYEQRLAAANATVEMPVRAIRRLLGLPPPPTS